MKEKAVLRCFEKFTFLFRQWMTFVLERCERGRGIKPRWASHGIDFLYIASSPNFTKFVSDEEFGAFKDLVEKCYGHVIGEAPSPKAGGGTGSGAVSPDAARHSRSPLGAALSSRTSSPRRRPASSTRATSESEGGGQQQQQQRPSLPRLHVS